MFNGSQKTRFDESFNFHLLIGANLLPDSRRHTHALAVVPIRTRVEKMYCQILVFLENQDYQRIL